MQETELYAPIKHYLELQGYTVKAEIGAADVVACRAGDPPLIVELKTGFSLQLLQQAVARLSITETVYVAIPTKTGKASRKSFQANVNLCRRLGLGVLTVRPRDGFVTALCDPAPYTPRMSKPRKVRLLKEFERRVGDPNKGGSSGRKIMTAYRQDALRCLSALRLGPRKGAEVAAETGVPNATRLMADDHYGWFDRVSRGIYECSPNGRLAFEDHAELIKELSQDAPIKACDAKEANL